MANPSSFSFNVDNLEVQAQYCRYQEETYPTMPVVSIIVPIYNCEKYLRQCLDSILAQSINDYEVILINDGSKDNSGEICDEYAKLDNRFKAIHKNNEGLSAARNDGLDVARGEWVTFN